MFKELRKARRREVVLGVALMAVATIVALFGARQTHPNDRTEIEAMPGVEVAYAHILQNVRSASNVMTPSDSTAANLLTVQTQKDISHGNLPATVTYSIEDGNLIETDSRVPGSSILIRNLSSFTVRRTGSAPTELTITLTSGKTPLVMRVLCVTCRNF